MHHQTMTDGKPLKIAITGGIGSGKSYVCARLKAHGIDIYDCDAAAKRLMRSSATLKRQLRETVGDDVYVKGRLNKARMAQYLLASDDNARRIDGIVHPAVAQDFIRSGYDWMECAILFESGFDRLVDFIVCVDAPAEVRMRRVMERDGITAEKTAEWMGRQWPPEEVRRSSHFVIVNDGIADLDQQIATLLDKLNSIKDPKDPKALNDLTAPNTLKTQK